MAKADDEEMKFADYEYEATPPLWRRQKYVRKAKSATIGLIAMVLLVCLLLTLLAWPSRSQRSTLTFGATNNDCDSVDQGYTCQPNISHIWGQYSPYFRVASDIPWEVPSGCNVTLAQILSRHGARWPTQYRSDQYRATMAGIKSRAQGLQLPESLAFLAQYDYDLGANDLTDFGRQELVNSGTFFFNKYADLAQKSLPFIRAAGQERVVDSAQRFSQGFSAAAAAASKKGANSLTSVSKRAANGHTSPYPILVIPEGPSSNNTLAHGSCTAYDTTRRDGIVQAKFGATFLPKIAARLNALAPSSPSLNLTSDEIIVLLDLCPYETVASSTNSTNSSSSNPLSNPSHSPSPLFCPLFTAFEWSLYNTYQNLGKYHGPGPGNPLGPTQGVGFVNELIARLTGKAVVDHTSVNHTLDDATSGSVADAGSGRGSGSATFPLNRTLYADFSHDGLMVGVFYALGLYDANLTATTTSSSSSPFFSTSPFPHRGASIDLSNADALTSRSTGIDPDFQIPSDFTAAETVPFAARAIVEKLSCPATSSGTSTGNNEGQEMVRIIVNGKVSPLAMCGGDKHGMCTLDAFVESLGFARSGGRWGECFQKGAA